MRTSDFAQQDRIPSATFVPGNSRWLVSAFLVAVFCAPFARAAGEATDFATLSVWWKDGQAALDLLRRKLKEDDALTSADKASLEFGFVKGAEEVLTVGGTPKAVERAQALFWSPSYVSELSSGALEFGTFSIVPQGIDFAADDALDRIERFQKRAAQVTKAILIQGLPADAVPLEELRLRISYSRLDVIGTLEKLAQVGNGLGSLPGLNPNRRSAVRFFRHTTAEDIQRRLRERFTTDTLQIEANLKLNAVYLQGDPATISQLEESILPGLDSPCPQYGAHVLLIRFPPGAPASSSKTILGKLRADYVVDWALIESWERNGLIGLTLGPRCITLAGLTGSIVIGDGNDPLRHSFKVSFTPEPVENSPKIRCTVEAVFIKDKEIVGR